MRFIVVTAVNVIADIVAPFSKINSITTNLASTTVIIVVTFKIPVSGINFGVIFIAAASTIIIILTLTFKNSFIITVARDESTIVAINPNTEIVYRLIMTVYYFNNHYLFVVFISVT
ncbi:hypothetical protein G9C98_003108 [Cotesia typhae]|uniref:Uncharacterized protein n=1 Tax=Cotesia typhae TaxID=2053667 RepID=A0A8J5QQS0_9HYME|nr:hypothetical protein G9C98_003108 [Cotesia typhae]